LKEYVFHGHSYVVTALAKDEKAELQSASLALTAAIGSDCATLNPTTEQKDNNNWNSTFRTPM
jgi:hypothetical protein